MTVLLGPTLGDELSASGCHNGVSWSADGTVTYDASLTQSQIKAIQAVLAAHDPTKQRTLMVTGRQFMNQLVNSNLLTNWNSVLTAAKVADTLYMNRVSLDSQVPADNPKLSRILKALGVASADIPSFFLAASQTPA